MSEELTIEEETHIHEWSTSGTWGVVIGLSRCKVCGKVAERTDFHHGTQREKQ